MRSVSPKRAKLNRAYEPIRQAVLARDNQTCVLCGCTGGDVHHRRQRSVGGSDNPVNLVTLCRRDHGEIHDDDTGLFKSLGYLMDSWETEDYVALWHNGFRAWVGFDGDTVEVLPVQVAQYLPTGPVAQLDAWLTARQRLFTLIHNSIPEEAS